MSQAPCRWASIRGRALMNFLIRQVYNSMADWRTASRKLGGIDPLDLELKRPLAGRVGGIL